MSSKGRAKRFAKIAGEMVSLGAVKDLAAGASPDHRHAAIARLDARKGEAVVLVSVDPALTRQRLIAAASQAGIPEIAIRRDVLAGCPIPVLGTDKTDYVALLAMVDERSATAVA